MQVKVIQMQQSTITGNGTGAVAQYNEFRNNAVREIFVTEEDSKILLVVVTICSKQTKHK